jgi:RHS repeat-associated protein
VTDQNGRTTTYSYDDADRLIAVTDAATPAGVTQYQYDSENNLINLTDALGRTTHFDYDENGRVTKTVFPSTFFETYVYDALGNLISKTDRKNQTILYNYDALRRLTRKQYPDGSQVNYAYDLASRLTQITDPTGTYQFTYDNMGRLTQTSTAYAFLVGRTFTIGYEYDAASNLKSMTDPEGGDTDYTYDTLNRLATLKNPQRKQFNFTYDALGRRTQLARPNSVNTNYQYDSVSRVTSLLHQYTTKQGATTTLDGAQYSHDLAGNRLSKTDNRTNIVSNYGYDPLYELTLVTQNGNAVESYAYDPVGNRLSSLNVAYYAYNPSNQLTNQPGVTYTYDNNGNLTSKTDGTGTTTYNWDFENRMTRVTLSGGPQVNFKYDPTGRRIQKASPSGTLNYIYDGANILEEVDAAGTLVTRYTQGLGMDEPLAILKSGVTSYYQADGLGSITSLSNSSGALVSTNNYDSFGKLVGSSGTITNPYRFTGRELDSETGLYYYRARYYDPSVGRFINEDPIRFEGGVDFFAYTFNHPVGMVDPTGLKCNKPSFASLWKNYPAPQTYPTAVSPSGRQSIWDLIGGKVALNGNGGVFKNSCAIRMSYALNKVGCQIPYVKGKTSSGANGDWHFFRLEDLSQFLQGEWGTPEALTPGGWKSALAGRSGMLQYDIHWRNATGHMSLWNGATNVDGPNYDYSNPAILNGGTFKGLMFWPLN